MRRLALLFVALTSCVVMQRDVVVPDGSGPAVVVGSAALGQPMAAIARHPWVALRDAGSARWERWEVMCCPNSSEFSTVRRHQRDPLDDYGGGGGDVRLHGVWRGAEAQRIIDCVRREAPAYPHRDQYLVWPGPNSNTFVDYLLRACDMDVELPAGSIGKDFRGLVIGASFTAGGTGLQLETPVVGIKLGLTEGVEIHILGMSLGIDLWPPAIIVPIGPGRIGFDDR